MDTGILHLNRYKTVSTYGKKEVRLNDIVLDKNLNGIKATSAIAAMDKWIPEMKKNGAEIIIMLTSFGVPWDRDEVYSDFINSDKTKINNAIELGYYSDDIDIIVSGGISKGYPKPWYDPNSHVYTFQNYIYIQFIHLCYFNILKSILFNTRSQVKRLTFLHENF